MHRSALFQAKQQKGAREEEEEEKFLKVRHETERSFSTPTFFSPSFPAAIVYPAVTMFR